MSTPDRSQERNRENRSPELSRREWLALAGATFAGVSLASCLPGSTDPADAVAPRLSARPTDVAMPSTTGRIDISEREVDAILYVPASVPSRTTVPLMLFLHGALRDPGPIVEALIPTTDQHGVVLLAPYSEIGTWDAIRLGYFSPDVARINAALDWVFSRWPVEPSRIALTGFSDGATYTLALGRANGDLFTRLVAFSPGYLIGVDAVGRPPIMVTHGRQDTILPYSNTSGSIVPGLRNAGYDVDFRTFEGGHAVLGSAAREVISDLGLATS